MKEGRYYYDDGTEYKPDLYSKPGICLLCKKDNDPTELILCNLNRMDQLLNHEFRCYDYEKT